METHTYADKEKDSQKETEKRQTNNLKDRGAVRERVRSKANKDKHGDMDDSRQVRDGGLEKGRV